MEPPELLALGEAALAEEEDGRLALEEEAAEELGAEDDEELREADEELQSVTKGAIERQCVRNKDECIIHMNTHEDGLEEDEEPPEVEEPPAAAPDEEEPRL